MLKKLIELVILAQIASDSGKRIYSLANALENTSRRKYAVVQGYSMKDLYIDQAIMLIRKNKIRECTFEVTLHDGYPLVYFNFDLSGSKYQVSFHSPGNENLARYMYKNGQRKQCETRWDHDDSRHTCLALARRVGIK